MFPVASSSSCEKTWAGLSQRGSVILPETQGWGIWNPNFACPSPISPSCPLPPPVTGAREEQAVQSSAESGLQSSAGSKPPHPRPRDPPVPSWHITPKHPNSPASRPLLRALRLP